MDAVIQDLQLSREKAAAVIVAAEERRTRLLQRTHIKAKSRIEGNKGDNRRALQELRDRLSEENGEKERNVIAETARIVAETRANGAKHLSELVDMLYETVVTVD